ncbi:hypothetical protein BJY00DRAFT_52478 [Aspergillus carlsbadensis]|nr:hypothetical protein BJY00DRAFT_52478 [Aspergillus carlsbadensis]
MGGEKARSSTESVPNPRFRRVAGFTSAMPLQSRPHTLTAEKLQPGYVTSCIEPLVGSASREQLSNYTKPLLKPHEYRCRVETIPDHPHQSVLLRCRYNTVSTLILVAIGGAINSGLMIGFANALSGSGVGPLFKPLTAYLL